MNTLRESLLNMVNCVDSEESTCPELFAAFSKNMPKSTAWDCLHKAYPDQVWRKHHTDTHWCWYAKIGEKWNKQKGRLTLANDPSDEMELAASFLDSKGLPSRMKAVFDRLNAEHGALVGRANWSNDQPTGLTVAELSRMRILGELCDEYVHRLYPGQTSNELLSILAAHGVESGPLKDQCREIDAKAAEHCEARRQLFEKVRRGEIT